MLLIDTDRFSEIIADRCNDGKYYYCEDCLNDNCLIMPEPDDFCSYGERLEPMKLIDKDTLAEILKGL